MERATDLLDLFGEFESVDSESVGKTAQYTKLRSTTIGSPSMHYRTLFERIEQVETTS